MGFKCGFVGLPNVGKSTLFNALTQAGIEAANFPFCTIEPNTGVVPVPDERLERIADIVQPAQTIATTMEFVDIAGLVEGASKGEGLGNKFLANIRETHAIAQVVRCFASDEITHVTGSIDPQDDIDTINTELALADLETCGRARERLIKVARSGDKDAASQVQLLERVIEHLDSGAPVRTLTVNESEQQQLHPLQLLTAKPMLYIANIGDAGEDAEAIAKVEEIASAESSLVVAINSLIESEIADLPPADRVLFLQDLGMSEPGLNRLIRAGYSLLKLHTFFTVGPKECRAWTVAQNALAPQAAGVIHSDFEHGFIRAEVVSYDDFVACDGEAGAKTQGKWQLQGKDYLVQDGDIMHFRFNT